MTKVEARKLLIKFLKAKKYKPDASLPYRGMVKIYNQIWGKNFLNPKKSYCSKEVADFFFEPCYVIDFLDNNFGVNINSKGLGTSVVREGIPFVVNLIKGLNDKN